MIVRPGVAVCRVLVATSSPARCLSNCTASTRPTPGLSFCSLRIGAGPSNKPVFRSHRRDSISGPAPTIFRTLSKILIPGRQVQWACLPLLSI